MDINNLLLAAKIHKKVRHESRASIHVGMKLSDAVNAIEQNIKSNGCGVAFPTGVSVNNCAAHWTPNPNDNTVIKYNDVIKFDIGTHISGDIIDSAYTVCFNKQYLPLLEASREATNAGLIEAGVDVRMSDIGAVIEEVMSSYQIIINKKLYDISVIRNLDGHSIGKYDIHSGETVPNTDNGDQSKMKEDTIYTVEAFATTGSGYVTAGDDCSHFMLNKSHIMPSITSDRDLLLNIKYNFGTLAFCRRWLNDMNITNHLMGLKRLVNIGVIEAHPPLYDIKDSYTSQYEHTFTITQGHKIIFSRGSDY